MEGKAFEQLQIKDDFMFSVIMRNPKYCKPFLERILGVKISRIEYPKSQETIDITADAKSVRLDIYVEDAENTVYNVEMQTVENRNLPKRTRYYQGMIDLNILEKGENYKNLKKMGIEVGTPLIIEYPCPKCKMIEVYEIYPTHYIHIRSYKRDVDNNK